MRFLNSEICNLEDAIGIALELEAELRFGLLLIFTDEFDQIEGYVVFDQPQHNLCDVQEWLVGNAPFSQQAVIFEIIAHDPDQLTDVDLAMFETTRTICASQAIELLDLIQVNDGCFRSFAVTVKPNQAWR